MIDPCFTTESYFAWVFSLDPDGDFAKSESANAAHKYALGLSMGDEIVSFTYTELLELFAAKKKALTSEKK